MTHTTKHTPGPWAARGTTVWGNPIDPVMGHLVVATTKTCAGENIGLANAHLIAAAPAMYEALKAMYTVLNVKENFKPGSQTIHAIEQAETALAQAEGKQ